VTPESAAIPQPQQARLPAEPVPDRIAKSRLHGATPHCECVLLRRHIESFES
jgi:hypothetical protein